MANIPEKLVKRAPEPVKVVEAPAPKLDTDAIAKSLAAFVKRVLEEHCKKMETVHNSHEKPPIMEWEMKVVRDDKTMLIDTIKVKAL